MKKEITLKYMIDDQEEGSHFDEAEIDMVMKAKSLAYALHDMHEILFRAARKHGYADSKLHNILQHAEDNGMTILNEEYNEEFNIVSEIIEALEEKYFEILTDHGIDLEKMVY